MNNNGRKISSKSLLILIFTVLFFSVTFNSPANYSPVIRFGKTLTSSSPPADTIPAGRFPPGLISVDTAHPACPTL
jgi:hypothetical protein